MSSTVGTIAGTTGLGSERQVVWAPISQLWWAFQFTSTNVISSWYSSDGSSWTAGSTVTIGAAHSSEGRDLMVTCKPISGIDTVWLCYVETPTTVYAVKARRATISGTSITFHTSETTLSQGNISGALTSPQYSGGGWEIATDNKIHCLNGGLDPNQDITWTGTTGADPGTGEQATPPSWGTQTVVDSSQTNVVKSGMTFAMPSGDIFHIGDDGSANSTTTGLTSYKLPSGGSWSTVGSATGTVSAFGKNDWGAVLRTTSDIHLVYRNAAGSLVHRRYNGSSWSAGQTIPSQNNLSGGGVALTSDGVSVWLAVIDTDAANTVRYIQWTAGAYTGHADAWDAAWSVLEGSTATRTFLGAARDTDGNGNLLAYWTEGSSMVAASAAAPFPPDPPGLANRDAISALGSSSASTTLAVAFTGTQPNAARGQKIIIGFWASWGGGAPSISSVKDNNTDVAGGHSYTASVSSVGSAQGVWLYWLDLPVSAVWTGNYTITVTFSAAPTEADGGAIAYSNMQLGAPSVTNNNTSTSASATPGAVNPPATPATYFAVVTDATGSNPATFTWPAPYLKELSQTNGSTQQAGSLGDALNSSGSQNPAITIDSSLWNAAQAAFPGAPSAAGPALSPETARWPTPRGVANWRAQQPFASGQRYAYPQLPGTQTVNLSGAIAGGGAIAATLSATAAISGPVTGVGSQRAAATEAASLTGSASGIGSLAASATEAAALAGTVAGQSAAAGSALEAATLSGAITGVAAAAANLQQQTGTQITGPVTGAGSLTATLTVSTALSGGMLAVAGLSATATEAAALVGALSGVGTVSGNAQAVSGTPVTGRVTGGGQMQGALSVSTAQSGGIGSSTRVVAAMAATAALRGQLSGAGSFAANLQPLGTAVPVGPPTSAVLQQPGRTTLNLSGSRSAAQPQEGRDEVEPQ